MHLDISVHFLGHTFYSRHRPQYLNYGRFGFFTSHELNHAFSGLVCASHFSFHLNFLSIDVPKFLELVFKRTRRFGRLDACWVENTLLQNDEMFSTTIFRFYQY